LIISVHVSVDLLVLTFCGQVLDTTFSWTVLQAKLNNEHLSNLRNFVNRVLSLIAKPSGRPILEAHSNSCRMHTILGKLWLYWEAKILHSCCEV